MLARYATRLRDAIDAVIAALSSTALILVTLIVLLDAMGRHVFSFSLLGAEEASRLLMVHPCFFGMHALLRRDGHVSVDVVMLPSSARAQRVRRGLVGFSAGTGQRSTTLPVPRYFLLLPVAIGTTPGAIAGFETMLRALTNTRRPLPGLAVVSEGAETARTGAGER